MKTSFLGLSLFATIFVTGQAHSQHEAERLSVDPDVISKLAPHIASDNVASMPEFQVTYSSIAKGNFGTVTKLTETIKTSRLASGLYEVKGHNSNAEGSWGSRTGLSLCGLLTVLNAGHGRSVLLGSSFVAGTYMEFRTSTESSGSSRLVDLETSATSLCNLIPGTNFSYRYHGKSRANISRPILADKKIDIETSSETICNASSTVSSAVEISPLLTGDYIEVSCTAIPKKGPRIETTWAYLMQHHYYLALKTNVGSARTEFTYSALN